MFSSFGIYGLFRQAFNWCWVVEYLLLNDFQQYSQVNGFSCECFFACCFKYESILKPLWQIVHTCSFLELWVDLCCFSKLLVLNDFEQCSQENGLSFEWFHICCFKYAFLLKALSQTEQICSLFGLWISWCVVKCCCILKLLPQWQWKLRTSEWQCMCIFK